ncbi:hypothetical protein M404DRAFT_1003054 [Pisolithus tinctorius Marx 270]|uniref:Uncharacterized protein n=1 Tax=Pisolithus tinctorius Marx 270 TaxID=870435 RepID=A0A0C3NKA4_PISTI|nr:hypothetical protein M404DRAFT_1003054 [Pisolithus tinctorius Marx 270]
MLMETPPSRASHHSISSIATEHNTEWYLRVMLNDPVNLFLSHRIPLVFSEGILCSVGGRSFSISGVNSTVIESNHNICRFRSTSATERTNSTCELEPTAWGATV